MTLRPETSLQMWMAHFLYAKHLQDMKKIWTNEKSLKTRCFQIIVHFYNLANFFILHRSFQLLSTVRVALTDNDNYSWIRLVILMDDTS